MSSPERRAYTLEELIPFGGDAATKAANRAELARLRAIEEAATALRERVRDWCTIPYRDGEDDAWATATNVAEDALMSAADAYDAALAGRGGPGEEAP